MHGTKTKNKIKLKLKADSSEETVWVVVHEGSPGEEVKLREGTICKKYVLSDSERERALWTDRVVKQKRKK